MNVFCCYLMMYLCIFCFFFFFKQKTAYEMRISDWTSDVCSSDLDEDHARQHAERHGDEQDDAMPPHRRPCAVGGGGEARGAALHRGVDQQARSRHQSPDRKSVV